MQLVIGNKNYSSWSLRAWLLLKSFAVLFDEINVSLAQPGLTERLRQFSPTSRVPVLIDNEKTFWDSLAICEYISEQYLDGKGWPAEPAIRGQARSITCEMHAGFTALRNELPMNCRARRRVSITQQCRNDIARIDHIWSHYPTSQTDQQQPWLFGDFCIADCFYAPVVLRVVTYDIPMSNAASAYVRSMLNHAALQTWLSEAQQETEMLPEDEKGEQSQNGRNF